MNTQKPTLVLLLVLLYTTLSFSQTTIWEEDFSAYADETTVGTANRWTLTTTPGVNAAAGSNNHFWTVANELEARNTSGLDQIFTTESINIAAFTNVSVTVNVSESGNLENTDFVDIYYSLDGGPETLFATNGQNNANFTAQVAQQTGIIGGTLQIIIKATTDSNGERVSFDNIRVQGVIGSSPGAVETDLQLWMRADAGIDAGEAIQNTEVTAWRDQSANAYVAAKEINGPEYKENSINFNPTLRFVRGQQTYLNLGQAANLDIKVGASLPDRSDITVFAAFLTDGAGAGTLLSKGNNNVRSYQLWLGDEDRVVHYTWGRDQTGTPEYDSRNWGDLHARNEPKITTGTVNVSGYKSYVNNIEDNMVFDLGVGEGAGVQDVLIGARRDGNGTDNTGTGNRLSGNIAEIIVYDRELDVFEIQKVNSYLAIKYGITIGYNDETFVLGNTPETQGIVYSGTSGDYIASDGSTLWDGLNNAGFGYNVFGIARDDNSSLLQLKSQSSNVQRIETSPGNATFLDAILTIEDEDLTLQNDLSYLLVGHNGQDISLHTAGLPVRTENLVNRIWRSRESNTDTGTTKLTFDMTQYLATIPNPEELHLYVADNASFTGYCNYEGTFNANNDRLNFTGINLGDNTYFTLGTPTELIGSQDIFFDGVQSHISGPRMLGGENRATLMAWVKPDTSFNTQGVIAGEEALYIYLNNNMVPGVAAVTDSGEFLFRDGLFSDAIQTNEWAHISATFNGNSNRLRLYVNGEEIGDLDNDTTFTGTTLSTTIGTENSEFAIGKNGAEFGTQYFFGDIDEVRVFDRSYDSVRLQRMIYQEIENNGGVVRGNIIPKDISTDGTNPINWTRLMAYYPMSSVKGNLVLDASGNNVQGKLNDIGNDIKTQTAPMPYETTSAGSWDNEATWLHGDVWDIENIANNSDYSIVNIKHDVNTSNDHTSIGLIIDSGVTLNVDNIQEINNTWYLELNGTLDLKDDSQLIQGINSDLVTSIDGKILRRQEGNTNMYWYNYWTSPVGTQSVTSLTDNNISGTNNTNNASFSLSMLNDDTGADIQFTTALQEAGKVSTRWLYNFQNGLTYNNWVGMSAATTLQPGIGYTQKGTGNAGSEQQYIFEGKPNNGTILLAADDVDGDGANESEQNVTMTTTLIGNPYASALDARQFITDNAGIIQGTILLWEQWAGNTHYLAQYEGGYGYINNMTTARAYQHPDIPIASQTQTQGIKTPSFYIPVAQGFFVEVVNDGDIEFNNGQRTFKQEDLGESTFFSPNDHSNNDRPNQTSRNEEEEGDVNPFQLLRFEFSTSAGASRHFVLGFGDTATDGFDYGLDGGFINDLPDEDMGSLFEGKQYTLQAFAPITPEKEVDLNLNTSGDYTYSLKIIEFTNFPEDQDVYLRDNLTGTYFDLRSEQAYEFTSTAGQHTNRFDVVFQSDDTLSNDTFDTDQVLIYVNNTQAKLFVKGFNEDAKSLTFTNMLGQNIKTLNAVNSNRLENGISTNNLASGVYIVTLKTQDNNQITKKIILE